MHWVSEVADAISPWAQIVGFLGGIAALIVYLRKLILGVGRAAQEAADQSTHAAVQSTESNETSKQAGEALVELAEELGKSKASQDWMARRNDDMLTALLENLAVNRDLLTAFRALPDRVQRLEEFAADAETHITGRLRLHPNDQENA